MKKIIIIKTAILAAALFAAGNTYAQKGFHVGAQWGPHLSYLTNRDDSQDPDFEYLTTWRGAFALNTQYGFTNFSGVGLSALYSFQGQRFRSAGTELFKRVEYIKVPVQLIYNYKTTDRLYMIYKIGPQLSFLTHAHMTDKNGNTLVPDQKNAYKSMELGGMASIGVGIELTPRFFADLTLRGDYGFTNAEDNDHNAHVNQPVVINNGNGQTVDRAMTHTSTLGVNAGLRYIICKCDRSATVKEDKRRK